VVCSGCHANFDPYGLVLETMTSSHRFRTVDPAYGPVDPTSLFAAPIGGGPVANAVDMAPPAGPERRVSSCVAKSVTQYALSTVNSPVDVGELRRAEDS